ncbi:MAG TPA: ResB-like family cytochrome C biogenesis protein [Geobacteraceae bacterium]|nr:ResB-like family cytochrome C biogenesis protein [Geobacteraceae bacterium]
MILFGLLAAAALPGTLLKNQQGYYHHPLFILLLVLFGLHLVFCTIRRWRSLAATTLIVHSGVLIVLAGGVLTATGYVATINIYEGESSRNVFRWDLQKDVPFDKEVRVARIHTEFHPAPLQIGVMKGTEKHSLKTIKTGESFKLDDYTVRADRFDPWKETVYFTVTQGSANIGTADTSGATTLPSGFPFSFKLVAFKDAVIKRFWVDLELLENGRKVVTGTTEINRPFNWNGLDFFNTQISLDEAKRPYAGLQIVRDPGKYVVYAGMTILSLGAVAAWYRRFFKK